MRQVTGGLASALYLGGSLVQGLAVALIIPFARPLLGPVAWGQVGTALSAIQIGIVVLSTGLPLSITRAYFSETDGPDVARAIHGVMSLIGVAVAALGILGSLLAAAAGLRGGSVVTLVVAILGLQVIVAGGFAMLRAMRAAHWFIIVGLLTALVPHLAGIALVMLYGPSAEVYLGGFVIVLALAAALVWALVKPNVHKRHSPDIRRAFMLGFPMIPHSLALIMLTQGPMSVIFALRGPVLAGEFYVIQVLATGSIQVVSALNNVWVTSILDTADGTLQSSFHRTASKALAMGSALTLGASGAAPFVLWVLAPDSPAYWLPGSILPVVAVAYVIYLQCNTVMFAQARTRALALVTPVVAAIGLTLVSVAALFADLVWLAVAYSAGFLLLGAAYFGLLKRWRSVEWPQQGLVLAVASVAIALLTLGMVGNPVHAAIRAIILGVAGLALVVMATRSERREARPDPSATATRSSGTRTGHR